MQFYYWPVESQRAESILPVIWGIGSSSLGELNVCVFYRPQTKSSSVKKQISQKGKKNRKAESSGEDDDDDDDEDDDDDDDEEDTPKRQTRGRGATKVKRWISKL